MSRPSLRLPPASLAGFPSSVPPSSLVRVCRRTNRTWWFSSDGFGRFDLDPPDGTCYLATDMFAALREATRAGPVTPDWVGERSLRHVDPPDRRARLAAVTRAKAAAFGLTTELVTVVPYDLPQAWASAFRRDGFSGIRHELRHDPRARPSGISLFGPLGIAGWPDGRQAPIRRVDLEAAGIAVIDIPPSTAVTIVS